MDDQLDSVDVGQVELEQDHVLRRLPQLLQHEDIALAWGLAEVAVEDQLTVIRAQGRHRSSRSRLAEELVEDVVVGDLVDSGLHHALPCGFTMRANKRSMMADLISRSPASMADSISL